MKTSLSTILTWMLLIVMALAFDPVGPPPKKTMEWTTLRLSRTIIPNINIVDATIEEAAHFISILEVPDSYKPAIDLSLIADKTQKVTFSGKNLTRLEALGKLAQAIDADILISPGKAKLIPRNDAGEQDSTGQPAPRPESKLEGSDKPQPEAEGRAR